MTPSNSYLSSKTFNYNSSWCFVVKFKITNSNSPTDIRFLIDVSSAYWSDGSQGQSSNPRLQLQNNSVLTILNGGTNNAYAATLYNTMLTSIYYNVSFNSTTNNIKMEFTNNTGTVVYTENLTYNYINKYLPWAIFVYDLELTFYKGIYYNSTGYVPWSTYSTYF